MCDLTERIANLDDASFSRDAIRKMHLLAASAGTGKTYSIQTLYLRQILVEGLTVQQILVVTFTKDATKELRDRLQRVLREALDYLNGTVKITDPTDRTKRLVDAARSDEKVARERLQLALLDFDMAAIYTIHGFCQRVLNRFAFETRQPFDVEPAGDTSDEIEQLCNDWWRRNVYPMDEKVTAFLSESGRFSLEAITTLAEKLIRKPDAKLLPEVGDSSSIEGRIPQLLEEFVKENPPVEKETEKYPNALEEVRTAVEAIQQSIKEFRGSVSNKEWDNALHVLDEIAGYKKVVQTSCQDKANALVAACTAFMEKVPARTQAKTFTYANSCLTSEKCPDLTSAHTAKIKSTATDLGFADLVRKFDPLSLYQKKAFNSTEVLCSHFDGVTQCDAQELYEAVKVIADGTGIAEQVAVTVDVINPAFRELRNSLFTECADAVSRAALEVKKQYRQGRPASATASFDDYLVNLRDALRMQAADQAGGLVGVLRQEFRAALIDEFQDTDPIQWGIFEKLFKDADIPCFLVGDPKQAIYRFRNGDVETYLKATGGVPEPAKYPLNRNHRSEKRLIDAVNQVFMDGDGRKTFGANIDYTVPLEAAGKDKDRSLLINGDADEKPFKIVLVDNSSSSILPGKKSPSAQRAYSLTAQEIANILNDKTLTIGDRRVSRKDIAVLVREHAEAEYIAKELAKLGIPAVRQGTGDVWKTDEGRTLWVVLEAVLDSGNLSNVRCALLSTWFGLTTDQIRDLNEGRQVNFQVGGQERGHALEDWVGVFEQLRETWLKRGFPAMFRKLMGILGLKTRLLRLQDRQGQRRLANINQLCELVERKISEDRKTPEGVLAWIRRQFDKETADGGDDVKLRLETDDDAVRIMTIFTSKGLEFPIVFAPTLFMMAPQRRGGVYEFHEGENLRIARKITGDRQSEKAKDKEQEEVEWEHVRQIYVALTRAVHRTVIVALNDRAADGKAKKDEDKKSTMQGILGKVLRLPMKKVVEDQEERIVVDLDQVDARFSNVANVQCAVQVLRDKDLAPAGAVQSDSTAVDREPAEVRPKPDTSKGHGSFSSLAPRDQRQSETTAVAFDTESGSKNRDGETAGQALEQVEQKPEGIFAFPSGARTGTCWHEIFEDLAFNACEEDVRKMVEEKLRIHGFLKNATKQEERIKVTTQMVQNVLVADLPGLNGALSTIEAGDRKEEWEFSFAALSGKRTRDLRDAIAKCSPYKNFVDVLGEWDREIPGGYLTGFVDLLFRKDGRYYIVDWKSNRRRGLQADFGQGGLREEMALHSYWLQYLIYTVAVHQFLSKSVAGYSYNEHFGGVYYIFLRGVDGGKDADGNVNGVYADRPDEALVGNLSAILGDFS